MSVIIQELNLMYGWLPGGAIAPISFCVLGFMYGMYRYIRSFKYIYYYYIEHGIVICNMDNRIDTVNLVAKKYKLPTKEYFEPHGYIMGILIIVLFTVVGIVIG